jgi:HPt (histidine-containing phosphotransfer) domain-containing protein
METPYRSPEGSVNQNPEANSSEKEIAAGPKPLEFDLEETLARFGGDYDLFAEMVEHFFLDSPVVVDAVRAGVEGNDLVAAARAAHRLKGTVGYFGASSLVATANRMEEASKDSRRDWAEAELAQLIQQVASLREILTPYYRQHSN